LATVTRFNHTILQAPIEGIVCKIGGFAPLRQGGTMIDVRGLVPRGASMTKLLFKDFRGWRNGREFLDVALTRVALDSQPDKALAFVFFGHVNLDFDGSPTAYGPFRLNPDDALGNAGNATQGWFGVASAPAAHPFVTSRQIEIDQTAPGFHRDGNPKLPIQFPVVQQARFGDPKPGFFVSTTPRNLARSLGAITAFRQNSYVDASKVAFGALDRFLQSTHNVQLGDFGLAVRHDENRQSGFSFVDIGGWNHALGECSHRVGLDLGVRKLGPGRWDNNFPVSFIVFPRTAISSPFNVVPGDSMIMSNLKAALSELARAENAHDLPLLMAINEKSPAGVAKGKAGLDAYRKAKGAHASNVATIHLGLATFGFQNPGLRPLVM
jgi:hypothetical protein